MCTKHHHFLKVGGAWYTLQHCDLETGELIKEYKFLSKDFENLMLENSELKDYCYGLICDACILKYDSKQLGVDDVVETDEVVDEL